MSSSSERNRAREEFLRVINDRLCSEEGEMWDAAFRQLLSQEKPWLATDPSKSILSAGAKIHLPECTDSFDPRAYYQNRSGLYVRDGFRNLVVRVAKKVDVVPAAEMTFFDLVCDANDAEIRGELPEGHVFEEQSAFCALLAGMIDRQRHGSDVPLLTNDYWNIFYVLVSGAVFAVSVYWSANHWGWFVDADPLYSVRWYAGSRAFSRK